MLAYPRNKNLMCRKIRARFPQILKVKFVSYSSFIFVVLGSLHVGDEILEISGKQIRGMTANEVAEIMVSHMCYIRTEWTRILQENKTCSF